ncbi:tripartite tricarboxylate transporter TctB family protein [Xanthobacteraceae bacterium Astr-EGSB]|uniref:tripartite tricarboxylate transporter TctB family protein n=1 Tax=Astrobacterium formosum TaxID=3069710 RepID=UPI0027AE492C|nr:tripartite tricarboxylate transporter TctB family protein [Xanthobacteraceae bacterium Astr-EGSB]
MQTRPLVRADLVTGAILAAFGLAAVAESYGMPRLAERNINPWTAPGVVPGMLGVIIALLGVILASRSLFAGAFHPQPVALSPEDAAEQRAGRWRLGMCSLLCFIYAVVLVGHIPFWLATGIFVLIFIIVFEWQANDEQPVRMRKLAFAGGIALLAATIIPYAFQNLFLVRLP